MVGLKYFLFSLLVSYFFCISVNAKYIYILDFDGTIVDDGRLNSSWKTPWVLRKVDQLRSSTQLNNSIRNSPETIEVSYGEYIHMMGLWSVGNGSLGSFKEVSLSDDPYLKRPKVIIPGHYYVDPNIAYKFYRSGAQQGENYLLNNFLEARNRIERQKLNPLDFAGPAFPVFQQALSHPNTVGDVHIFTARNQMAEEFQTFFNQLQLFGFINYSVGENKRGVTTTPNIHQLQGIDSILYGRNLVEGKKNVVENLIRQIANSSSTPTLDYSAENPNLVVSTHTIIVAEDDPINIKALMHLMNELSHAHTTRKLKLVLMNTGADAILSSLPFPYNTRWIVFNQGFTRAATENEIKNYEGENLIPQNIPPLNSLSISNAGMCSTFLNNSKEL